MDGKHDKQEVGLTLAFTGAIITIMLIIQYCYINGILLPNNVFSQTIYSLIQPFKRWGLLFVVKAIIYPMIVLLSLHLMNQKRENEDVKKYWVYIYPSFILYLPFIWGYIYSNQPTELNPYSYRIEVNLWNLAVYPFIFLAFTICLFRFSRYFIKESILSNDDPLNDVSCKDANEMSIEFPVKVSTGESKLMRVHSPQQGIYISGGAGAGKSASLVEPALYQFIMKGFAVYNYDFKGSEYPLSLCVYNTIQFNKDKIIAAGYKVPTFHFVNVLKPLQSTGKLNPISPKYIKKRLYAMAAAEVIFKNLDKSSIEKTDFWTNNGMNYTGACIWRLVKFSQENPHYSHICTVPHLVTLMLRPIIQVVAWLLEDEEIGPTVAAIKDAFDNDAGSQLSGISASAQLPLSKLYDKDIFWLFNPLNEAEEIPLQINNPDNPIALNICNNEPIKDAVGPLIGLVTNSVISAINDAKYHHKTVLAVDELPTQYIKDIDFVPATMRSKNVVTLLALQEYSQMVKDYGDKLAKVILGNMGNQFIGMSNDSEYAEKVAKMFGEYDKKQQSISNSESGQSTTDSLKREKVRQGTDIAGQPLGHFSGKIAGGEPPFFSCQFPDGRIHLLLGIEKKDLLDIPYRFHVQDNFTDKETQLKFQQTIHTKMIDENFKNIISDIDTLLTPYIIQPE